MRSQHPALKSASISEEPRHAGAAVLVGQRVALVGGLRDVNVQQGVALAGSSGDLSARAHAEVVRRVRCEPDGDAARRVVVLVVHPGDLGNAIGDGAAVVEVRHRQHPRTHDLSDAGLAARIDHLVLEGIHLARGRHARAQHLDRAERHPPPHIGGAEAPLTRPHHLGEPRHQRQAVARAAHQGHRRVRVSIHKPRHQQPAHADHRCIGRRRIRCGTDPGNPPVGPHIDGAPVEHGEGLVAGQHDIGQESGAACAR